MELVKKFYADRDKYRIDIVLVPSPGEPKEELRRLWCSKEKGKINNLDILRWLMGSKSDIEKDCSLKKKQKNVRRNLW